MHRLVAVLRDVNADAPSDPRFSDIRIRKHPEIARCSCCDRAQSPTGHFFACTCYLCCFTRLIHATIAFPRSAIPTPYDTLYDTPPLRHHLPVSVSPTCPPPLVPFLSQNLSHLSQNLSHAVLLYSLHESEIKRLQYLHNYSPHTFC